MTTEKGAKKQQRREEDSEFWENVFAFSVVLVLVFLFIGFWNKWWGFFDDKSIDNPLVSVPLGEDPVLGNESAPITIVEYSDFQCDFCAQWFRNTYPLIKKRYIDTGKAKLVFKHYPLRSIHPKSFEAAIAAACAYNQGNNYFWEYHDLLFQEGNLNGEALQSYAEELGLDSSLFKQCYENQETKGKVARDFKGGVSAGVTGTPSFVIGRTGFNFKGYLLLAGCQSTAFSQQLFHRFLTKGINGGCHKGILEQLRIIVKRGLGLM